MLPNSKNAKPVVGSVANDITVRMFLVVGVVMVSMAVVLGVVLFHIP